ncbi:MAG: UvrD-helicase domain-containing protein [Succinivibrionaceae bacterium]|nr:UvrD-helicase domain-containing protein [Succinivibrionaceae bacterium]
MIDPVAGGGAPFSLMGFDLGQSSLIEASAGTGKTYTISNLMLRLLLEPQRGNGMGEAPGLLDISSILVVTFTNAAAADLRRRILARLREARRLFERLAATDPGVTDPAALLLAIPDEGLREIATDQLSRPRQGAWAAHARWCARLLTSAERGIDEAPICTIHSFCMRVLNEMFSFETGQPFDLTLTTALGEELDAAARMVWRRIFYRDDLADRALLEAVMVGHDAGPAPFLPLLRSLPKVRLGRRSEGAYGYRVDPALLGLLDTRHSVEEEFWRQRDEMQREREAAEAQLRAGLCDPTLLSAIGAVCRAYRPADGKVEGVMGLTKAKAVLAPWKRPLEALSALGGGEDRLPAALLALRRAEIAGVGETGDLLLRRYGKEKKDPRPGEAAFVAAARGLLDSVDRHLERAEARVACLRLLTAIMMRDEVALSCERERIIDSDMILSRLDDALKSRALGTELAGKVRARFPVAMIDEFQDTDPTQFSIFSRIYLNREAMAAGARCFMIGDRKQSIYAFRGTDIDSYLGAEGVLGGQMGLNDTRHTLKVNYRSTPGVVKAVNDIFALGPATRVREAAQGTGLEALLPEPGELGRGSFLDPRIAFEAALPHKQADGERLELPCAGGQAMDGQRALHLSYLGVADRDALAMACALDIRRCLGEGRIVGKDGTAHAVTPADITVLVQSAYEHSRVERALSSLGLGCVYYSDRGSVAAETVGAFGQEERVLSPAATDLSYLLEAMLDCSDAGKVRRLLGSRLLSATAGELHAFLGEGGLEGEARLLRECARLWRESGFLGAFLKWLRDPSHNCIARQLSTPGGERLLTDCYHLAELLQDQHLLQSGPLAELSWFLRLPETGGDYDEEVLRKRLESEQGKIKVMTVHFSKGLQFPLVFMPFLCGKRRTRGKGFGEAVYRGEGGRTLALSAQDHAAAIASAEREEQYRLVYVALTRAVLANFLYPHPSGQVGPGEALQPLSVLLALPKGKIPDPGAEGERPPEWPDLIGRPDYAVLEAAQQIPTRGTGAALAAPGAAPAGLSLSELEDGMVSQGFRVTSFSGLLDGQHDLRDTRHEPDDPDPGDEALALAGDLPLARLSYPRGSRPGDFFHHLLERCDFGHVGEQDYRLELIGNVAGQDPGQVMRQWERERPDLGRELPALLSGWLQECAAAPLPGTGGQCLGSLGAGDWMPEMEYLLPIEGLDSAALHRCCVQNATEALLSRPGRGDEALAACKEAIGGLAFASTFAVAEGFLKGFLDNVCRFRVDGGYRYFVIDYKTNFLGPQVRDYSALSCDLAVFSNSNRYDVQYLLYTEALVRHLRMRMGGGFDYGRDFGGVIYLFVRGLGAAPGSPGVFFARPSKAVMDSLGRALGREAW